MEKLPGEDDVVYQSAVNVEADQFVFRHKHVSFILFNKVLNNL